MGNEEEHSRRMLYAEQWGLSVVRMVNRMRPSWKGWELTVEKTRGLDVVMHTFDLILGTQKKEDLCEFSANLVYIVSSRTA